MLEKFFAAVCAL